MLKGIIFDVDGAVIDTERIHFLTYKKVLKKYGYNLTEEASKKHFSGKSIKGGLLSLMSEVDLKHNIDLDEFIEKFCREKIKATLPLFKTEIKFFPDTIGFINKIKKGDIALKKIGYLAANPKMALTTGLERIYLKEILKHHNLKNIFSVFVIAEDYIQSKPDPECYKVTLSKMKLKAREVFGIEDAPSGVIALNRAGIFSVGLSTTHSKKELKEAKLVVSKLTDLLPKA